MDVGFSVKRFTGVLALIIGALTLAHVVQHTCTKTQGCGTLTGPLNRYGWLLDLNQEQNIPTWYASSQLFLCAGVLALIALGAWHEQSALAGRWSVLTLVFLYLSLDEATDLHGLWQVVLPNDYRIPGTADAAFSWMIPGAILVVLGALFFRSFVFRLPGRTRQWFIVAGGVYITGVLGLEAVGSVLADDTWVNTSYFVVSTLEEVLEMVGILIFLYALLAYLERQGLRFHIGTAVPTEHVATQATP